MRKRAALWLPALVGLSATAAWAADSCWKDESTALAQIQLARDSGEKSPAQLELPYPDTLATVEKFQAQVSSRWKAECSNPSILGINPEFNARMLEFSRDVIFQGLRRIWDLNPSLADAAIYRAEKTKVKFGCPQKDPDHWTGQTTHHPLSYIGLKKWEGNIKLDIPISEFIAYSTKGSLRSLPEWMGAAGTRHHEFLRSEISSTVFHEFLHAIRLDSQSFGKHNKGPIPANHHRNGELDLIYACSAQAYPGSAIRRESLATVGLRDYKNSYLACMACASATAGKNTKKSKLSCEFPALLEAHARCEHIAGPGLHTYDMDEYLALVAYVKVKNDLR